MKIKKKMMTAVGCLALIFSLFCVSAQAEERTGELSISPMAGMYVFDHDQDIEKDLIAALGLGYNFTPNWACEFMMNYGRFDYESFDFNACRCKKQAIDGLSMHLDALYNFWPEKKLVPYLAAGIGGVLLEDHCNHNDYATLNWGGGIKYFLDEDFALRADVRHLYDLEASNNNASFSIGLTFQFGGEEKPVPAAPTPEPAPAPSIATAPVPVPIADFVPAPVKEKITLDMNLQFGLNKAAITPQHHDSLKKLADFLKEYPEINADIEGHTCSLGTAVYNMGLSIRRAENVKKFLVENYGIDASRLAIHGYGLTRPIADNSTREGRVKNRRVHVVVSNAAGTENSPARAAE